MPYYGYYGGYGDFLANNIYCILLIPVLLPVGAGAGQRKLQTVQRCCQPAASHRRPGGGSGAPGPRRL